MSAYKYEFKHQKPVHVNSRTNGPRYSITEEKLNAKGEKVEVEIYFKSLAEALKVA